MSQEINEAFEQASNLTDEVLGTNENVESTIETEPETVTENVETEPETVTENVETEPETVTVEPETVTVEPETVTENVETEPETVTAEPESTDVDPAKLARIIEIIKSENYFRHLQIGKMFDGVQEPSFELVSEFIVAFKAYGFCSTREHFEMFRLFDEIKTL